MLQTHIESKNGLQSFIEASPEEELFPLGIASIQGQMKKMADFGRNGDIYVVHAAEGETVIPLEVLNANPKVRDLLFTQMTEMGLDPERYVVGNELNSLNPVTGAPEFFFSRIFNSVKKRVKKLRGTGVFTTLLPLAGQFLGVPGGPKFLRPGTAGSNLVYGMLGEYLEQGKDFDPKKAAKRLALNLAKGVAFKGGMNILAGRDVGTGIDASYFTGEGYQSTAEKFGFGDSDDAISASALQRTSDLQARNYGDRGLPIKDTSIETSPTELIAQVGGGDDFLVGSESGDPLGRSHLIRPYGGYTNAQQVLRGTPYTQTDNRPTTLAQTQNPNLQQFVGRPESQRPSSNTILSTLPGQRAPERANIAADVKVDAANVEVDAANAQREALRADIVSKMTEEQLTEFEWLERQSMAAKYLHGDDTALIKHYLETQEKQRAAANKTGLFGYKGPLGLPSLGNQLTDNKGLANIIDLAGYGGATYWLGDKAGLFEDDYDEDEEQPKRSDLAGFVDRETGADLLAANPEKYRLPEEALDPYLFVDREPTSAAKGGMIQKMATGGFPRRQLLVEGQGTGTSDEIPAMLSDGEFVMTNRAVEGADPSGNGDRYAGAQNLYGMMRDFEMRA